MAELRKKIVKLCKMVGGLTGMMNKIDENAPEYYALECVVSDEQADVFGSPNLTRLALALNEAGCEVHSVQEKDESLESYFLSLVGGERHE